MSGSQLSSLSSRQQEAQNRGEGLWLLSLGDLLTLLLGFFIALIGSSPLNPAVRSTNSEHSTSNSGGGSSRLSDAEVGTAIAELDMQTPETPVRHVVFGEDDFEAMGMSMRDGVYGSRVSAAIPESYRVSGMLIESCGGVSGASGASGWDGAAARALAVRGQAIDSGMDAKLIKVRLLGPDCAALGVGSETNPLMRIEFATVADG